nr:hypothetical protein [Paraburkholderia lacunae]
MSQAATASSRSTLAPLSKATGRRIVFSSSVGNAPEWFDFLVYGYFATIMAKQFFPLQDEWLSTLLAIAIVGISFLMRSLGTVVLGIYGDRKGREATLTLAIALMSEIVTTQVRSTGLSIGYSIGVTIFGGFAPTVVETFIHLTGDKLAPIYHVLIAAMLLGASLVVGA